MSGPKSDENSYIFGKKTNKQTNKQKTQPLRKKPGDFYPVFRKGPFGGAMLLEKTVKQMLFERANILDENRDIFDRVS